MDYNKLGLRVGLEIHQQLASGTKLFCRCPIKKSEEFPLEINRKMILLEEPIRSLGEFPVKIKLQPGVMTEIKITVVGEA